MCGRSVPINGLLRSTAIAVVTTLGVTGSGRAQAPSSPPVALPTVEVISTTPIPARTTTQPRRAPATGTGTTRTPAPQQQPTEPAPAVARPDPAAIDRDKVPSNTQVMGAKDFSYQYSTNILDAFSRSLPGVSLGDQTGNAFQRNLDYRGFIAGPMPGQPQSIAVYQNGVRINESFGDVVNWDFIPQI